MTRTFTLRPDEEARRREATDPQRSVFLTANAGSGKTTILTSRVIRLMLDGAEPSRILCLTYTKAAAAEMSNRIFGELGAWVRLADADLRDRLVKMRGGRIGEADLAAARALFAKAVETPGGLKIQTIHAFAERLLHLFPFEANVPARFTVMDDIAKAEMMERAKRATILSAIDAPESDVGAAFYALANIVDEGTFDSLLKDALNLLRQARTGAEDAAGWRAQLGAALLIDPAETEETVAAAMLRECGPQRSQFPEILAALAEVTPTKFEKHLVKHLGLIEGMTGTLAQAEALIDLFTTSAGGLRAQMLSKAGNAQLPWLAALLEDAKARLPGLIDRLNAVRVLDRSTALMAVADAVVHRYRGDKQRRALVDFDDMIDRALQLVERDHGASWVLMKLDGGIDHLLIDEAQDTTPQMWRIAKALTAEFFAGAGARPGARTVFAVGDEKQSIYSFQGAAPAAFDESRRHFERHAAEAGEAFSHHPLHLSFRTVSDILSAVDTVFSAPQRYAGLTAQPERTLHETARAGEPGFAEIWPLEPPPEKDHKDAWEPVDTAGQGSAQLRLAARLAREVAGLIANETYENDGVPIRAGDIMILVQQRDAFFEAVIRALKRAGVPVAGADRLTLTSEIAVMDLIAAAKCALLPADDLTIAEALKSPLIGLSDEDLLALAPRRAGSLFDALGASGTPAHVRAYATIARWQDLAAKRSPYDFFAYILGPMGGRRALLARLGPDAVDGIDLFLANVLERESREPPSLSGEIAAFEMLTGDVKRDQGHGGGAVRVLTVHGAKGLEARIVYLPDAHRVPSPTKEGGLFAQQSGQYPGRTVLLWSNSKANDPALIQKLRDERRAAKLDEYRRLLYVAMTRARDRLYIAGWGDANTIIPKGESWYAMAHQALADQAQSIAREDGTTILQYRITPLTEVMPAPQSDAQITTPGAKSAQIPLPDWIWQPVADEPQTLPPLRPSRALDAADQVVSAERQLARLRGDLIHALLEQLPLVAAENRAAFAERTLSQRAPGLDAARRTQIRDAALGLLADPALVPLFGPDSQAEVAMAGQVRLRDGSQRDVLGRIDRLLVLPTRVVFADIKTGAALRRRDLVQLALYRALLTEIFPGRDIEALVIHTATADVERIAPERLDEVLTAL